MNLISITTFFIKKLLLLFFLVHVYFLFCVIRDDLKKCMFRYYLIYCYFSISDALILLLPFSIYERRSCGISFRRNRQGWSERSTALHCQAFVYFIFCFLSFYFYVMKISSSFSLLLDVPLSLLYYCIRINEDTTQTSFFFLLLIIHHLLLATTTK